LARSREPHDQREDEQDRKLYQSNGWAAAQADRLDTECFRIFNEDIMGFFGKGNTGTDGNDPKKSLP